MFTLNNISSLFEEFVAAHHNLGNSQSDASKHYYYGIAGEHENKYGGIKYPLVVAELQTSTIGPKIESYEFKMWFMTQHKLYEGRDIEMMSDLKLIATDFCIWLKNTKFAADKTVTIDDNIVMTDFTPSFNDLTCGWYFTLRIKQFLDWDLCRIPMVGAPGPDANQNVKVYDQDGNLLYTLYYGQTLTIEVLQQIIQTLTNPAPVTLIQTLT
jgi:hypothetical protein